MRLIVAEGVPDSPARVHPPTRAPWRVGAVQHRWHADPAAHEAALSEGIALAAGAGARLVCLAELTFSPYMAVDPSGPGPGTVQPEALPGGPTHRFAAAQAARHGVHVHASLYEAATDGGLGYNTAICVAPSGALVARTRKLHLPVTAGYHEDRWFQPGDTGYPVVAVPAVPAVPPPVGPAPPASPEGPGAGAIVGFPTCWDQWFPELARIYSLAGAEVLVYPTAIGSEPDHPSFDTQTLWRQVMVGHAIANGVFVIAVNRVGTEDPEAASRSALSFYGSSFMADPYGRILVEAPRDEPVALVADLDLDARRDWLDLFPLLATRRPDTYGPLCAS